MNGPAGPSHVGITRDRVDLPIHLLVLSLYQKDDAVDIFLSTLREQLLWTRNLASVCEMRYGSYVDILDYIKRARRLPWFNALVVVAHGDAVGEPLFQDTRRAHARSEDSSKTGSSAAGEESWAGLRMLLAINGYSSEYVLFLATCKAGRISVVRGFQIGSARPIAVITPEKATDLEAIEGAAAISSFINEMCEEGRTELTWASIEAIGGQNRKKYPGILHLWTYEEAQTEGIFG